jgi:hypothetical protein
MSEQEIKSELDKIKEEIDNLNIKDTDSLINFVKTNFILSKRLSEHVGQITKLTFDNWEMIEKSQKEIADLKINSFSQWNRLSQVKRLVIIALVGIGIVGASWLLVSLSQVYQVALLSAGIGALFPVIAKALYDEWKS